MLCVTPYPSRILHKLRCTTVWVGSGFVYSEPTSYGSDFGLVWVSGWVRTGLDWVGLNCIYTNPAQIQPRPQTQPEYICLPELVAQRIYNGSLFPVNCGIIAQLNSFSQSIKQYYLYPLGFSTCSILDSSIST